MKRRARSGSAFRKKVWKCNTDNKKTPDHLIVNREEGVASLSTESTIHVVDNLLLDQPELYQILLILFIVRYGTYRTVLSPVYV